MMVITLIMMWTQELIFFSSWHYDGDSNEHSLASARAHNITMSPDNNQHVRTYT